MAEFQRFQEAPQFNPMAIVESGQRVAEQGRQIVEALQTFQGQTVQRDQNRIEDARFNQSAEVLKAFGQFSQSAANTVKTIEQQNAKNREIDAQYNSIYNPELSPEELAIYRTAAAQQSTAGEAANRLEAAGDDLGAEALRQDLNQVGQGVQNEKALLMRARTNFAGEVLQMVNSNEELSRLYATDPNTAMEIATKLFIEKYGLQYTTKNAFVDIMGGTIRNVIQNTTTQQMTQIIKERRVEQLAENDSATSGEVVEFMARSDFGNTVRYQELAEDYMLDNNGILTQGAANRRAASTLLTAAANKGDKDLVAAIGRIQVIPGNKGATLANSFPDLFSAALLDSGKARQANIRANRQEVFDQLGQGLQGIEDPNQRLQLLEGAREALGTDFQGVLQLNQQYPELVASPNATATYMGLSNQIAQGQTLRDDDIDDRVASGELTVALGDKLKRQNAERLKPATKRATASAKVSSGRFRYILATNIGASVDPSGFFIDGRSKEDQRPFDNKTAQNIVSSYKTDLDLYLKDQIQGINISEYSPQDLDKLIQGWTTDFYNEQTGQGGKYYLGGVFDQAGYVSRDRDKEQFDNVRGAGLAFGQSTAVRTGEGKQNFSNSWNPGMGTKQLEGKYELGDILYDKQEVETLVGQYKDNGITSDVGRVAKGLGVSPREFLESQAEAYGLELPEAYVSSADKVTFKESEPWQDKYYKQTAKTIPYFIARGYSPQGAAAMAVALQYIDREAWEEERPLDDPLRHFNSKARSVLAKENWLELGDNTAGESLGLFTSMDTTRKRLAQILKTKLPARFHQNLESEIGRMLRYAGY
jgi:hypothetical protein